MVTAADMPDFFQVIFFLRSKQLPGPGEGRRRTEEPSIISIITIHLGRSQMFRPCPFSIDKTWRQIGQPGSVRFGFNDAPRLWCFVIVPGRFMVWLWVAVRRCEEKEKNERARSQV